MERINLTKNRTEIIPVTINGKEIDLPFNAEDMLTRTVVLDMASDIAEYEAKGPEITALAKEAKDPSKVIEALAKMKEFANEGIALCKSLSLRMCEIAKDWPAIVGDNFVSLGTFEDLIRCMEALITKKDVENKVNAQLEDER